MRFLMFAVPAMVGLLLAGCGGSGGGASTAEPVISPPAWTVTPGALTATPDLSFSGSVVVTAQSNVSVSDPVYAVAVDPQGVFYLSQSAKRLADGRYQFTLATSRRLAVGRYTGSLELRLCPVADCAQQHPGSPLRVPYDVAVVNPYKLPPLSRIPGLADWETHQGNAAHTGYVPLSLDASKFTARWRWQLFDNRTMGVPVVANNKVYVATAGDLSDYKLQAFNELDGTLAWEYGTFFYTSSPAVSNGAVYFANSSGFSDGVLWSLNASDGALRFRSTGSSTQRAAGPQSPTVMAGKVYTNSVVNGNGGTGGTQSLDAATGALVWSNVWDNAYAFQAGTPALDAKFAYAAWTSFGTTGKVKVYAMDSATGAIAKVTDLGNAGPTSDPVPVLAGNGGLLVSDGQTLRLVQPLNGTISWAVDTWSGSTDPVVAGDTVFVVNGSTKQLEARSLATGALLWAWQIDAALDQHFMNNLVVTDSHVFVSTRRATYAIDRNSHSPAGWTYPAAGHKAISANGILYIVTMGESQPGFSPSSDGGLTAINLR